MPCLHLACNVLALVSSEQWKDNQLHAIAGNLAVPSPRDR